MEKLLMKSKMKTFMVGQKIKKVLRDKSGQGSLETAITILLAVVLGALLLAGLYYLFENVILPTLTSKIQQMFNYAG